MIDGGPLQVYIKGENVDFGFWWKWNRDDNEPVFLVSEFCLRYLLIFKYQILVLDFSGIYQKKNETILRLEDKAQYAKIWKKVQYREAALSFCLNRLLHWSQDIKRGFAFR